MSQISVLHPCTRDYFGGTYSADLLPDTILQRPSFIFVNSQPHDIKVGHWLLLMLPCRTRSVQFYDPLGRGPESYHPAILQFIRSQSPSKYIINSVRHQSSASSNCGFFCLFVVDLRCRGQSFEDCMNKFDADDLEGNDTLVTDYFLTHIYVQPLIGYLDISMVKGGSERGDQNVL